MTEVAAHANFSRIRYAQCWEDADILLEALAPAPGGVYVSIASAGDNALAILSKGPAKVVALDLNPAQLACVALRVAAYKNLTHGELLELMGARASTRREELYRRCRNALASDARGFWDRHGAQIQAGIGAAGKFEDYFALFRRRVIPLIHSRRRIAELLQGGTHAQRAAFYERDWNTWRWRALFKIFFSRFVMGRLGRDPSFFRYVEGSVADRILTRTRHALVELNPHDNPYLQWILTGAYPYALPYALRAENFEAIRNNIDRFEWRLASIEDYLAEVPARSIAGFNLSDIFEYMSAENYRKLLDTLIRSARPGARLAYWNMLAPRSAPPEYKDRLISHDALAQKLFLQDKAFFYSAFVVEEVI